MTDPVSMLNRAADKLDGIIAECSPGPWFYDSYSAIFSEPKLRTDDAWHEPYLNTEHTLEGRGHCPACDTDGCAHAHESYVQDSRVAGVPAEYGDTATDSRAKDAQYIEAMNPVVGRAIVDELRHAAKELERRLPIWTDRYVHKLDAWDNDRQTDPDTVRPATVDALMGRHYGRMLIIARTVLGDPIDTRRLPGDHLVTDRGLPPIY